jgi:putative ATP-dependent endonuclease of OLD family
MYLKSFTIKNFRKFSNTNNTVYFVEPTSIQSDDISTDNAVISPSSTLIIGKNNAGKTTIANALTLLCDNAQPKASDFNIIYLRKLFEQYTKAHDEGKDFDILSSPELEFTIRVTVDTLQNDLMVNLSPFIAISDASAESGDDEANVNIIARVEVTEVAAFKEVVKTIFTTGGELKEKFIKFYELLNNKLADLETEKRLFKTNFYTIHGAEVKGFVLKNLIQIKEIKANRHLKKNVLSEVYNKIVAFQFDNDSSQKQKLESQIKKINTGLTGVIDGKKGDICSVLTEVETNNQVDLDLTGNVTYDSILKNLIKYSFNDNGNFIPEDQFGLGYINLLNIIGEIIHYVDTYENKSHNSHINLLFIEEPEAFMHPQMQEFFINRIDAAVSKALEVANQSIQKNEEKKVLNCQIAITTHSSHIVNSKIHSSNSFNNINYLNDINKQATVVKLTDQVVVGEEAGPEALQFIKKHIKYKVSELFFSDAVLFVEGVTEELLLKLYIENDVILKNYYISVFNINGAHGKLYRPLAKALKIPCLIITDIDIKREKCEKNQQHELSESCERCGQKANTNENDFVPGNAPEYKQITNLKNRETTNQTLINFNKGLKGLDGIEYFTDDNFHVVFQKESIEKQFATSLEEALILTNYSNNIINSAIEECKSNTYTEVVGRGGKNKKNLISNSFKLQRKLASSKSKFSNTLTFKCLVSEQGLRPKLPNYIIDGFDWLKDRLQPKKEDNTSTIQGVEHDSE